MAVTLKIVHLVALSAILGFGILKGVLVARGRKAGPEVLEEHRALQVFMGLGGLIAIAVLWITGLAMLGHVYNWQWLDLGGVFHAKLTAVIIFTAASLFAWWAGARGRRTGKPFPHAFMAAAGTGASAMLLLAVILAVMTFSG